MGNCVAKRCANNKLQGSSTTCKGATGDACNYKCTNRTSAAGVSVAMFSQGVHRCQADGKFNGGKCVQGKTASIDTQPRALTARVPQFGSVVVSFNVTNGGAADLYLTSVRSNQTWAGVFQQSPTASLNLKTPVKPKNSTTFRVALVGSGVCCGPGTYIAAIILKSNDPNKPQVEVLVKMTVFEAALTLVPIPDSFELLDMPTSWDATRQVFSLHNFHSASLYWHVPGCKGANLTVSNWIVVAPCSGKLKSGAVASITVGVVAGVTAGTSSSKFDVVGRSAPAFLPWRTRSGCWVKLLHQHPSLTPSPRHLRAYLTVNELRQVCRLSSWSIKVSKQVVADVRDFNATVALLRLPRKIEAGRDFLMLAAPQDTYGNAIRTPGLELLPTLACADSTRSWTVPAVMLYDSSSRTYRVSTRVQTTASCDVVIKHRQGSSMREVFRAKALVKAIECGGAGGIPSLVVSTGGAHLSSQRLPNTRERGCLHN